MVLGQRQSGGRNQGCLNRSLLKGVGSPLASVQHVVEVSVADQQADNQSMQKERLGEWRADAIGLID
jgi:hypothetical protein